MKKLCEMDLDEIFVNRCIFLGGSESSKTELIDDAQVTWGYAIQSSHRGHWLRLQQAGKLSLALFRQSDSGLVPQECSSLFDGSGKHERRQIQPIKNSRLIKQFFGFLCSF